MNYRLKIKALLLPLCMLAAQLAFGQQTFTQAFSSATGSKKVTIQAENIELEIEGYSGNEVRIESEGYEGPPERAKGLKPLYNNASDNTGLGLQVNESNNEISIRKATTQDLSYKMMVPANATLVIEEIGWTGDDFHLSNLTGEIEIQSNGSDIYLNNVSGPVVASTTSGDIDIVYSALNQDKPSSISNVSGHIDVQLPTSAKANLDLSSVTGEIYTNLDIKMPEEKEGMRQLGGRKVKGTLNGGGVEISLKAISDNIYLRAAE